MNDYLFHRLRQLLHPLRRRGHGVHSPFVFDLITNVMRERAPYYAFRDLEPPDARGRECHRLLFRLAEREGYRRALLVGQGDDLPARYLSAVSRDMVLLDGGDSPLDAPPWELFHAGSLTRDDGEWPRWLAARDDTRACALITAIHENRVNRALWEYFREESRVSIDATRYGLLFFDRRLQPGRYVL
jgi:hypothetical protein